MMFLTPFSLAAVSSGCQILCLELSLAGVNNDGSVVSIGQNMWLRLS